MLTLHVRAAVPEDLETLRRWREETAEWLARRHGSAQWSGAFRPRRRLAWIEQGATVMAMLEPAGEPVATLSVLTAGSARYWSAAELAAPAHYLHKLNVARGHADLGIGALLLDWARARAARAGVPLVRCNTRSDNAGLHAYYRARGWRLVRTVPGAASGTLFEAPAARSPGLPVHEADGLGTAVPV